MSKYLHIIQDSHIVYDFIKFNDENFSSKDHIYFLFTRKNKLNKLKSLTERNDFKTFSFINFLLFIKLILSKKTNIFIHGLFDRILVPLFLFLPIKYDNLYWFLWGADVYNDLYKKTIKHKLFFVLKKNFVKKIQYVITYLNGDVDFLKKHYYFKGNHLYSICYNSNLFINCASELYVENYNFNILIGNSAVPENNHLRVMDFISKLNLPNKVKISKILVPLSYGDFNYRSTVIDRGELLFKNQFEPIIDMLNINEYLKKIDDIDIAIFDHSYQMAMGNIISLLGKGKAVFLNKNTSPFQFFNENGIKVFDIHDLHNFNLKLSKKINQKTWKLNNIKQIKKIFNKRKLVNQFLNIYKY